MEHPSTPRGKEAAHNPRAPCFHLASGAMTPKQRSEHAASANEVSSLSASIDAVCPVPELGTAHASNGTRCSSKPIKPVESELNLLFHVNYIRKLLARQKRDLFHLRAATSSSAALAAESPELPGGRAMAVIEVMIPTWETSIQAAIHLCGQLGEHIRLLGRGKTLEPPCGVLACSTATATDPSSSSNSHWRATGDLGIAQSEDGDPFIDSPAKASINHSSPRTGVKDSSLALAGPLHLSYHAEITALPWSRIYMPSSHDTTITQVCSRRVLIENLPPSICLAQLLGCSSSHGGIIGASIVPDLAGCSNVGSRAAVVEFVYASSAAIFARSVGAGGTNLSYAAQDGTALEARVSLIPTNSFSYTTLDHDLLHNGATRALGLLSFPIGWVWSFLSTVGLRHMVDVWYNEKQGSLVVEFVSLFQADRVRRLIEHSGLHFYRPGDGARVQYVSDSTQETRDGVPDISRRANIIGYIAQDHLHQSWNRLPYNRHASGQRQPAKLVRVQNVEAASTPPPCAASPSSTEALAEALCISPSEVSSYLAERKDFRETEYSIVGSTIKLVRRAWSWSISAEDDTKLLMANTLHEPGWEDEWDRHFAARGAVNLRTWERYGRLARHRRERAAKSGLEEWRVPRCEALCPWGCSDMKASPMPVLVREYLDAPRRELLPSDDEQEGYHNGL